MSPNLMPSSGLADVLILCALQDEYLALLSVSTGLTGQGWKERKTSSGWQIAEAQFLSDSGSPVHVIASFCAFMGKEQASATLAHLWGEVPARCIAMSGICAGRRGKVALGDVLIADRLYSYDAGKLTVVDGVSNFQGDPIQVGPGPHWVQRMQIVARVAPGSWINERPQLTLETQEDWVLLCGMKGLLPQAHPDFWLACPDWPLVLERLLKRGLIDDKGLITSAGKNRADELHLQFDGKPRPTPSFQVHVAPIATGSAVVEDDKIFSRLGESVRKVLGLDMEASALGAVGEFIRVPVIVAKGVSDFGDPDKDDRYRKFAARASAEYLVLLMRQSLDLLHGTSPARSSVSTDTQVQPPSLCAGVPRDLIDFLSDSYPSHDDARAVWVRAGGKAGQVPTMNRAFDTWQRIWMLTQQGASVSPANLLSEVKHDFPHNLVLNRYLSQCDR
ncbi:5'-methylthioadenosine/S-adenosylhomocysteine nucleosidase [Pseudomonas fluorescens]|nr:5'-methylthioadenosine/S-adenosylhomocysteine nucleosidase [Pseudomonas fluorescens]